MLGGFGPKWKSRVELGGTPELGARGRFFPKGVPRPVRRAGPHAGRPRRPPPSELGLSPVFVNLAKTGKGTPKAEPKLGNKRTKQIKARLRFVAGCALLLF